MAVQPGIVPSKAEFKLLSDAYGFSLIDGVEFIVANSMILSPPANKFGIYLKTFYTGVCIPLTDF